METDFTVKNRFNYIEPGTKCGYKWGKSEFKEVYDEFYDRAISKMVWEHNCGHEAKHRIYNEMMHGSRVYCECHYWQTRIDGGERYLSRIDEVKEQIKNAQEELAKIKDCN